MGLDSAPGRTGHPAVPEPAGWKGVRPRRGSGADRLWEDLELVRGGESRPGCSRLALASPLPPAVALPRDDLRLLPAQAGGVRLSRLQAGEPQRHDRPGVNA